MTRSLKFSVATIWSGPALAASQPSLAADVDPAGGITTSRVSQQELQQRIIQLERRNQTLEIQNRAIEEQLNAQKQAIEGLGHPMWSNYGVADATTILSMLERT